MTLSTLIALIAVACLVEPDAALSGGPSWEVLGGILIVFGLIGVFQKAGRRGWEALVPVYAEATLLRVNGQSLWWLGFIFDLTPENRSESMC